jgi:hypothetical protein
VTGVESALTTLMKKKCIRVKCRRMTFRMNISTKTSDNVS